MSVDDLRLHTPRLTLRRFKVSDLAALTAYRHDPVVVQFQGFRSDETEDELRQFIVDMQTCAPLSGLQIAVALRQTDALIGDVYLRGIMDAQAEIGYTFARQHQGHGYATEAVTRLLDYCFADLALHRVIAICSARNAASIKLLTRIGMRREAHMRESYRYSGEWHDEFQYAMLRQEWQ